MQILRSGSNNSFPQSLPHGWGGVKGFTLIELMIVLVLGGLLMGVVATSLSEGPVLRKSSREVATSLRHARAMAVMRQQPVVWKMDTKAKRFWIDDKGGNSTKGNETDTHDLNTAVEAKINTTVSEVDSAGQGGIRFFPDGGSTGGSVELTFRQQTFRVNVEWVTGRVSIQ